MHDMIYDKGHVVAHIKLGSVFAEVGGAKVGSLSGGKIFSNDGRVLGSFRGVSDQSPDKSLSAAFRAVLNLEA